MTRETKMDATASDTLMATFEAYKAANDARLRELETRGTEDVVRTEEIARLDSALNEQKAAIDRISLQMARPGRAGVAVEETPANPSWHRYFRTGDVAGLMEMKSLNAGSDPDGGYLAPEDTEARVMRRVSEVSPMRRIATVRRTSAGVFRKPVSLGGAGAGWVAETDPRTQTQSPTLSLLNFPAAELYAMPAATSALLDDAFVDLDAWLADEVRDVFAAQESAAFVNGDGTNKPDGFLNATKTAEASHQWGDIGYIATGTAGDFSSAPVDDLIDLIHTPKSRYRGRGRFVMNRSTVSALRKVKDNDGNYIWQPSSSAGEASTLLGYPITEMEDMPDIAAGSFSIAFGDFEAGYLIVDRAGLKVLRDPYSSKPYVLFYTTKRVGGGIQDFDAIKLLKFAAS